MTTEISIENKEMAMEDIPGPKGQFLTGNLSQIDFEKFHQYVKVNALEYGEIYRLSFAHKPVVVVSSPDSIRQILKNRPEKYRRISNIQAVFSELGVDGVFSSEGEEWKVQRQIMNQAFKVNQLENYYPIIEKSTSRLKKVLEQVVLDEQTIDIQALLQRYTVDITTNLAFGYDMNSLNNDDTEFQQKINRIFPMLSSRIKAVFPYWRYFKLNKDKQLDEAIEFLHAQSAKFIALAEKNLAAGKAPSNILEAMISAKDEDGNGFRQEQLFPNIVTLLLAGEDTTANSLSWVLHYLSLYPEFQDRIYAEIQSISNPQQAFREPGFDDFPILSAVVQEAMRLMPVVPFLYLENNATENICGYKIPNGTMIVTLLSQSGHSADLYEAPEKFSPERWLNMSVENRKKLTKDLLHFGSGARQCPGRQLSFAEMKCALIELLGNFKFDTKSSSDKTVDLFAFTVMPKNLQLSVSQR